MKEVRLEIRAKNAKLWHLIFDHHRSVAEFSEKHQVNQGKVGDLLNLKDSPVTKFGEYSKTAQRLAEIAVLTPEELFPARLYAKVLPVVVREFSLAQLPGRKDPTPLLSSIADPYDMESDLDRSNLHRAIQEVMGTLSPKEQQILRLRFGLDGHEALTLAEVGQKFGVQPERVRQIEGKALRHLRHPARSNRLKEFVEA